MKYRCLSLWQPWATLAAAGVKKFETRGKDTKIRGTVLLHAAAKFNHDLHTIATQNPFFVTLRELGFKFYGNPGGRNNCRDTMPRGAIIGAVNIIRTFPSEDLSEFFQAKEKGIALRPTLQIIGNHVPSYDQARLTEAFGDYGPDRFAWQLEDCVTFKEPIPAKGSQGFFFADLDIPEMKDFPIK